MKQNKSDNSWFNRYLFIDTAIALTLIVVIIFLGKQLNAIIYQTILIIIGVAWFIFMVIINILSQRRKDSVKKL